MMKYLSRNQTTRSLARLLSKLSFHSTSNSAITLNKMTI